MSERKYYDRYDVVCTGDHLLPSFPGEVPDRIIGKATSDGGDITVWLDAMPVTGLMRLVLKERRDP